MIPDNPVPDMKWGPEEKTAPYPSLEDDILLLLKKKLVNDNLFTGGSHSYTWAVFSESGRFKGLKASRWVPKNCTIVGKISVDSTKGEDNVIPIFQDEEIKEPAPQMLIRKSELS